MQRYSPVYCFPYDLGVVSDAAELGVPYAMWRMGNNYAMGHRVEVDFQMAGEFYRRAADLGDPLAQRSLAFMLESGQLGKPDQEAAFELYMKAAAQGLARAQYKAAQYLLYGTGVKRDWERAFKLLGIAAMNGIAEAEAHLYYMNLFGTPLPDGHAEAVRRIMREAHQGDLQARHTAGLFRLAGIGFKLSEEQAMEEFELAAAGGYPASRQVLANLLLKRDPVKSDGTKQRALLLTMQAAMDGDGDAMLQLGHYQALGTGTPVDLNEAETWFGKAMDMNHPAAGAMMGWLLTMKDSSDEAFHEAIRLATVSDSLGSDEGKSFLAYLAAREAERLKDHPGLAKWLADGVIPGSNHALLTLGKRLVDRGGDDAKRGLFWFQSVAEDDDVDGHLALARAYMDGVGGRKRMAEAVALLGCAASLGSAEAAARLALVYNFNEGVVRNRTYAASANEFAALRGDTVAQHNLSIQLRHGQGVESDDAAADYWNQVWVGSSLSGTYEHGNGTCIEPAKPLVNRKREANVLEFRPPMAKAQPK